MKMSKIIVVSLMESYKSNLKYIEKYDYIVDKNISELEELCISGKITVSDMRKLHNYFISKNCPYYHFFEDRNSSIKCQLYRIGVSRYFCSKDFYNSSFELYLKGEPYPSFITENDYINYPVYYDDLKKEVC